ncbi:hypothetical protein BDZ89DRAFT_329719 [Hymenopellis radicata]|nr:hypothetical protein BDZ89DRAFT_329719 [Hymenopellis radicata]
MCLCESIVSWYYDVRLSWSLSIFSYLLPGLVMLYLHHGIHLFSLFRSLLSSVLQMKSLTLPAVAPSKNFKVRTMCCRTRQVPAVELRTELLGYIRGNVDIQSTRRRWCPIFGNYVVNNPLNRNIALAGSW